MNTREYTLEETSRGDKQSGGRKYGGDGAMMMVADGGDGGGGGGHVRVTRESCVEARDRFLAIP